MKKFKDCTGQEALSYALSLFARSTLLESSPAFVHMYRALEYISRGANAAACRSYHDAVGCMVKSHALRMSGSMWKDEILHTLVLSDNPFSGMMTSCNGEYADMEIFREELQTLCALSELDTKTILSMIKEAPHHKGGQKDNISVMSAAVWAGGHTKPLPRMEAGEKEAQPLNIPVAFTPLEYKDGNQSRLLSFYASGDGVEELYARLLEEDDWEKLAPDFRDFFSIYGTGKFLRHRAFRVQGDELIPLKEEFFTPVVPVSLYEKQHVFLMENTIRFMRGERAQRILLTGESGVGKTAHVVSLVNELPEMRFILAGERDMEQLPAIIDSIAKQPLNFLLLLDDIDINGDEFRLMASRTMGFRAIPDNLLIYATARKGYNGAFAHTLNFPYPNANQFETLICELLESEGITPSKQAVHNAAVDYQVDAREKLTFTGAMAIAEKLRV